MKYFSVLLAAGCFVTAVAQQWQVELVDTSCTPGDVFVKRDTGQTYVAYVTGEGNIRIATKDTIWHYETLDTSLARPDAGLHFALGPAGRMCVSGVDDSVRPLVLQRADSGWVRVWTHPVLGSSAPLARAVYGADSSPIVIYAVNDYGFAAICYVIAETWVDSVWQVDTAAYFSPGSGNVELTLYDADGSREAGPCFLIRYIQGFPKSAHPWEEIGVYKGYRFGADWALDALGGGLYAVVNGYDIVARGPSAASAAVYVDGYTDFDLDPVCADRVIDAAVQADSAGREQIAYVTSDNALRFGYKDTRWHYRELPGVARARCCDLALDDSGQPMIAFEDDGGLWLAHGVDMLGAKEAPSAELRTPKSGPTILSGASGVKRLASSVIFDAMGRRVVDPRSGVCFVCERSAASGEPSAVTVRKVVIQH